MRRPAPCLTFSYLALTTDLPLSIVVNRIDDGISNLLLLAVPMFVVLGLLMEMTGIAQVMVKFLAALIGHVKGGLSYVLLGAMYLVSGISGSKAADMAAVAPILFPEMRRRGAHPGEPPRYSPLRVRCPRRSHRAWCLSRSARSPTYRSSHCLPPVYCLHLWPHSASSSSAGSARVKPISAPAPGRP